MKYRIAHLSDTHLGYSDLDRVSAEGVNQREADFYRSLDEIITRIISLAPEVVVHTGDFFHRPSPANRPLIEGLRQLKRLSDAGIPVVVIAGNHSTPRTLYTSPILTAFGSVDGVYPVFRQRYERVELGDFVFHGLPHINDEAAFAREATLLEPSPKRINVLMLHTSVGRDFIMDEYGERVFPEAALSSINEFDYTALGHWHNAQSAGRKYPRAWYSGSTERLSDREADTEKGFCTVEFIGPGKVKIEFHPVNVRPWRRYDIRDCGGGSIESILSSIKEHADSADHNDAMVSVYLHSLDTGQAAELANARIAGYFPNALSVAVRRIFRAGGSSGIGAISTEGTGIRELFELYLKEKIENDNERVDMIKRAGGYFHSYETGD